MTTKLYHGTAAKFLPAIQAEGLLPRAVSKSKGNWSHTVNSNRKAVYLTDAYAWHFATSVSGLKEPGLILEIDRTLLKAWKLCPDEDFLEAGSRRLSPNDSNPNFAPVEWDMKRRLRHYRALAEHNPKLADDSLKSLGTVAYYDSIPWRAVSRYVVIDWSKLDPSMAIKAVDSQVSLLNYRFLQDRHRAFTRWFFGDKVSAQEITGNDGVETVDGSPLPDWVAEVDKRYAAAMLQRDGLKVTINSASTFAHLGS